VTAEEKTPVASEAGAEVVDIPHSGDASKMSAVAEQEAREDIQRKAREEAEKEAARKKARAEAEREAKKRAEREKEREAAAAELARAPPLAAAAKAVASKPRGAWGKPLPKAVLSASATSTEKKQPEDDEPLPEAELTTSATSTEKKEPEDDEPLPKAELTASASPTEKKEPEDDEFEEAREHDEEEYEATSPQRPLPTPLEEPVERDDDEAREDRNEHENEDGDDEDDDDEEEMEDISEPDVRREEQDEAEPTDDIDEEVVTAVEGDESNVEEAETERDDGEASEGPAVGGDSACVEPANYDSSIEDIETVDSSGNCLKGDADHTDDDEARSDEAGSSVGSVPSVHERTVGIGGEAADSDAERSASSAAAGSGEQPPSSSSVNHRSLSGPISLRPMTGTGGRRSGKTSLLGGLTAMIAPRPCAEAVVRSEFLRYREALVDVSKPREVHLVAAPPPEGWDSVSSRPTPSGSRGLEKRNSTGAMIRNTPKFSSGGRRSRREDFEPAQPLEVSSSSWVAQQRNFHEEKQTAESTEVDNATITRRIRALLNKLTLEKFNPLLQQLMECGISTQEHLEILMHEIMEKATTQHHFIGMYTNLCTILHDWAAENAIGDSSQGSFKRILLNECQNSFERHLKRPDKLKELTGDDLVEAEVKYKTARVGNIRFVGALLAKSMVASQVIFKVTGELLKSPPEPDALESLAAFLTTIGPIFDRPDWKRKSTLDLVFKEIEGLTRDQERIPARIRCLLSDVLDLRRTSWEDQKLATKSNAGPMTLDEVHSQWQEAAGDSRGSAPPTPGSTRPRSSASSATSSWSTVGPRRDSARSDREPGARASTPVGGSVSRAAPQHQTPTSRSQSSGSKWGSEARDTPSRVNPAKVRRELCSAVKELALSHDSAEALRRVSEMRIPEDLQAGEFAHVLSQMAEEGSSENRAVCFSFAAKLFVDGVLLKTKLVPALDKFFKQSYQELEVDMPALPAICRNECLPALEELVRAGLLSAAQHKAYVEGIQ